MATLSSRLTPLTVSVPAMSAWTAYTDPVTNGGTATFSYQLRQWRRVGDSMEIQYRFSVTAGGSGASTVFVPLPSGFNINTALVVNDGIDGYYQIVNVTNYAFGGVARFVTGTTTGFALTVAGTNAALTGAGLTNTASYYVRATLPISGWTSHTASATSANAVVVGGQSVGSTMNFGATSNQGFNILANNVAAIASTAAGALTLGLPSAIGGSTYAGQAIVGRTNGSAISAGYVGERISATGGGIVTGSMPAANTVANVNSMSLTAGIWHVFGSVAFSSGATTAFGADNYVGASISTTSATENAANANFIFFSSTGAGVTRNSSTFDTLNLSATTTVYLTTRHNATTIGGASYLAIGTTGARFYAIRIA